MKSRRDPKKPYVDDGPTIRQLHPDFADQFDDKTEPQAGPPPDDVLTEDDIDDQAPTVERRLPKGALSPGLPRFEMTGTITLPRSPHDDEPIVRTETEVEPVIVRTETEVEPVTLRQKRPVAPAPAKVPPPARPLPPPKPLRPPQPLPSPRPAPAAFSLREPPLPSDFAPTPVRRIPSSPAPPARRIPSVSPPPPARRPTSVAPPAPERRHTSVAPPAPERRPTSVAPPAPARRPTSVAPPAPERRHTSVAPPARAAYVAPRPAAGRAPSERPPPTEVRVRPRPPEYGAPRADATRPFPLQEPERRGAGETPSHTPPPLTASTPPPAAVSSRPPTRPTAPVFSSFPPPAPIPRLRSSTRVSLEAHRNRRNLVAAGVGIASALAISAVIGVMVAITVRTDDAPTSAPTLPARRITPARAPEGVVAPSLPVTVPTVTATAQAPTIAPTPAGAAVGGCRLERRAQRLAGPAMPTVLPMVATAPGTARVAVGYASGRNHADGIVVHLDDLTVEPRYSEELPRPVLRVTPLTDRAPVAFAVDHDESGVQAVRTIPAHPPFRVGVSFFGFVRVNESMSPSVVWPGGRYEALSEPAFAATDRDGYGVAFRSGRGSGDVFTGWLTPSGTADGDLVRVDAGAREVGAPAIAASDRGVAVVFAARASGEVWRLRGATATRGRVPQTSRELDVALPGAGDTISPSLVALPSGGWVVQWLEGAQNARRVLARTLNDKLEPEGLPVELGSQPGIQDTPGALVVRDGRVLAVQLVAVDRSVELWGAVLACGAP